MSKKLALLLVLVLLLTLPFTACSSTKQRDSDSSSQEKTKASDSSSIDTSSGGSKYKISAPGVLPIVDEKVELEFMMPYKSTVTDYEDNKFTRHLEEMTNVKIKFNERTSKVNSCSSSQSPLETKTVNSPSFSFRAAAAVM